MILPFLILAVSASNCPTPKWQKSGESSKLKWARNTSIDQGVLNLKISVKRDAMPAAVIEEMTLTKEHVPFTVGLVFQQCLPNIQILSDFNQIRYINLPIRELIRT